VIEAVDEALGLGERAGVPVHVSHHKAKGSGNHGKVAVTLGRIDAARARGLDVTLDVYPYTATSTVLRALLPGWAHEGGAEATRARLRDREARARLVAALTSGRVHGVSQPDGPETWDRIVISTCRGERAFEGRSVWAIAEAAGRPAAETVLDILLNGGLDTGMVVFCMSDDDVDRVLRHPVAMVASDGEALPVDDPDALGKPHPRAFGTFPRVLGRYVRDRQVLTLEDAVRKMTSQPAERLGLGDRGVVAEGAWADLVVFDPARVADAATYDEPCRPPVGIVHVVVNGTPVVADGRLLGARPGRVLRRGRA
ncbi:MAG TPA: amidohydrolase family protein, partial [Thermodesulfobacteriota bacterium]